jgi:predicted dehydrogenase
LRGDAAAVDNEQNEVMMNTDTGTTGEITRFALIGAGGMGTIHARDITGFPDAELTWVVDIDLPRARKVAEMCGSTPTDSIDEALAADDVDAVVIALPTFLHAMATIKAAEAGKHVFCEKPIARTLEDAQVMIDACAQAGVRLMIGHVVRFFDEYAEIKQILDAGTIGQVGMVRASRLNTPVMGAPGREWFADLEKNGGVIIDLTIHEFDTLRWYFGEVERLYAHGLSYTPYQKQRDYCMVSLRFENGVTALCESSWAHSNFRTAIEISGQYGIIKRSSEGSSTLQIESTANGEGPAAQALAGALGSSAPLYDLPKRIWLQPLPLSPYQREKRHFIDCLRSGEPFLTTGEEGKKALALALAALASMRDGTTIHFAGGVAEGAAQGAEVQA